MEGFIKVFSEFFRFKWKQYISDYKFHPRYFNIMWMLAGRLATNEHKSTTLNKNAVQDFFNDLFSPPRDEALSYEINLFAHCFTECASRQNMSQYPTFINDVVNYLRINLNPTLNINLFKKAPYLLEHQEILEVVKENLQSVRKQFLTMTWINEMDLSQVGQPVSDAIFAVLLDLFQQRLNMTKTFAARALKHYIRKKPIISKKTLSLLLKIFADKDADSRAKQDVVDILGNVSQYDNIPDKIVNSLLAMLRDPTIELKHKDYAIKALGNIAQKGLSLYKIVVYLIKVLKNPLSLSFKNVQEAAVGSLRQIVNVDPAFSQQVVPFFIQMLKNPRVDSVIKLWIAGGLRDFAEKRGAFPKDAINSLTGIFKDLEVDECGFVEVLIDVIRELAQANPTLLDYVKICLTEIIKYLKRTPNDKELNTQALRKIAQMEHILFESVIFSVEDKEVCNQEEDNEARTSDQKARLSESTGISLIEILQDPNTNLETKRSTVEDLGKLAKSGQRLPDNTIATLIKVSEDSQIKTHAIRALEKFAQADYELPKSFATCCLTVLKEEMVSFDLDQCAINILIKFTRRGQIPVKEMVNSLIEILGHLNSNPHASLQISKLSYLIINGLIKAAQYASDVPHVISEEDLFDRIRQYQIAEALINLIEGDQAELISKRLTQYIGVNHATVHILTNICQKGFKISLQSIEKFIEFMEKPHIVHDDYVFLSIREILTKININLYNLSESSNKQVLFQLFRFNGKACFCENKRFHFFDDHRKYSIESSTQCLIS